MSIYSVSADVLLKISVDKVPLELRLTNTNKSVNFNHVIDLSEYSNLDAVRQSLQILPYKRVTAEVEVDDEEIDEKAKAYFNEMAIQKKWKPEKSQENAKKMIPAIAKARAAYWAEEQFTKMITGEGAWTIDYTLLPESDKEVVTDNIISYQASISNFIGTKKINKKQAFLIHAADEVAVDEDLGKLNLRKTNEEKAQQSAKEEPKAPVKQPVRQEQKPVEQQAPKTYSYVTHFNVVATMKLIQPLTARITIKPPQGVSADEVVYDMDLYELPDVLKVAIPQKLAGEFHSLDVKKNKKIIEDNIWKNLEADVASNFSNLSISAYTNDRFVGGAGVVSDNLYSFESDEVAIKIDGPLIGNQE